MMFKSGFNLIISFLVIALSSVFFGVFIGCSSVTKTESGTDASKASEPSSNLFLSQAKARKERLSDVRYDLNVDLRSALSKDLDANFSGVLTLRFKLKDTESDLRVDFHEGELSELVLNSVPQTKDVILTAKKKYWIDLPKSGLRVGENEIKFSYIQKYARTGQGLHRFRDPVDNRVYLYSQFETFEANRFLPCFDQPDLRSVLTLTAVAPKEWVVVTGGKELSKKIAGSDRTWTFEPTLAISTYLFSLHAGPYALFTDVHQRKDGSRLPLRFYVRESLKSYFPRKDFFTATKQSLGFFENYFEVKYPFSKLDQLVVPEFNSGGMENVAAVTYSEWFIPRSPMTRAQRRGLSNVVFHEIAHMWFGDLVTMSWWNGLWLNESFATYMAFLGQAEASEFKESWQSFGAGIKRYAYVEDAMGTTHPIEATIDSVKEAETIFDGITYNKGAAVLKQLNFYMTPEEFQRGIRDYFKTYAFKNTTLENFIGSLQAHTKKDLTVWSDRWLRQSGTDRVTASWRCEADRLKSIDVELRTTEGRLSRPQSVEVGLYKAENKKTILSDKIRVDFQKSDANSVQTATLRGDWNCPQFVYPNHDDHGYVSVNIDPVSLSYISSNLSTIADLSTRSMVWNDLWRMVRDVDLPLKDYVAVLSKNFPTETDEVILQQVLRTMTGYGGNVVSYWPTAPESKKDLATFVSSMEADFLKRLESSSSGSDEEKIWFQAFLRMAETPKAMDQMYRWYTAGKVSKKFPLDVDRSWSIATSLRRYSHPKSDIVFAQMKQKDQSDRGLKNSLSTEVVAPEIDLKKKWVSEFMVKAPEKKQSLEESQAVLYSLFPREQSEMKTSFSEDFFRYLEANRNSEDQLFVGSVLENLAPLNCEDGLSRRLKEQVNAYGDMNPSFKKSFLMSLEEDELCQKVRRKSGL